MKSNFNKSNNPSKMKTKISLVALMLVSITVLSLGCTESKAAVVNEIRNTGSFYGIILNGNANVILTQGESNSVSVEGEETNVSEVETKVVSGALVIGTGSLRNVTVHVTMNDISLLQVNGNGVITGKTLLYSDVLLLKVNGNGTINTDVRALSVGMVINGGGKIIARGSAGDSYIKVKGTGQVYAMNLDAVSKSCPVNSLQPSYSYDTKFDKSQAALRMCITN